MAHLISAQEYRDDEIVEAKLAAQDFAVAVSPVFVLDGEEYQVVMDGHHSYEAAMIAGVEPNFDVQTVRDNDTIAMLDAGRIDDFLAAHRIDSDYRFVTTGKYVW